VRRSRAPQAWESRLFHHIERCSIESNASPARGEVVKKAAFLSAPACALALGACGTSVIGDAGAAIDAAADSGRDPIDAARDSGNAPDPDAGLAPFNIAFVTSTEHDGDLGGLAGADSICNERALAAGLAGNYVAWLSIRGQGAIDRLGSASGWVRTDGQPFARSRASLMRGEILYPLRLDENGDEAFDDLSAALAWTGIATTPAGSDDGTCADWSSASSEIVARTGSGISGRGAWDSSRNDRCDLAHPLYCFGTDRAVEVPAPSAEGPIAFLSEADAPGDDGRDRFDSLCQDEADAAGLEGEFLAWVADAGEAANARYGVSGGTWARVDGVQLAIDRRTFVIRSAFVAPIAVTAGGVYLDDVGVWTGLPEASSWLQPGTAETTCSGFSEAAETARTARSSSSSYQGTGVSPSTCNQRHHVFCVER
jgi:hypothetical protein